MGISTKIMLRPENFQKPVHLILLTYAMDDSSELLTIITSSEIAGVDKLQKGGVNINSPKRP